MVVQSGGGTRVVVQGGGTRVVLGCNVVVESKSYWAATSCWGAACCGSLAVPTSCHYYLPLHFASKSIDGFPSLHRYLCTHTDGANLSMSPTDVDSQPTVYHHTYHRLPRHFSRSTTTLLTYHHTSLFLHFPSYFPPTSLLLSFLHSHHHNSVLRPFPM